jgi:hypothetical protein
MSSSVDICNQALLMLGSLPIISFDDESVEASACKTLYPTAKKQLLRSYPWRCATTVEKLAQLAEEPTDPAWRYAFAVPENTVRTIEILGLGHPQGPPIPWVLEGKKILSNNENIAARIIKEISEPDLDVHVEMALVARMALDLSYTLTASQNRETSLYQQYMEKLNEARTTDRQEASHKKFRIDTLDRVRR